IGALAAADSSSSLWAMIQAGGWAMIPLAACSLAVIYLAIHCYRETRPRAFGDDAIARSVAQSVADGRIEEAVAYVENNDTVLAAILRDALPKLDASDPEGSAERFRASADEGLELAEHATGQWIHYLSVVANTAPMIGLLGTVSGMIGGFQTMSAGGMGRPELFAGDRKSTRLNSSHVKIS